MKFVVDKHTKMRVLVRMGQIFSDAQYELSVRMGQIPASVDLPVPYFSQYARDEDVERIVRGELKTINDPNWHLTGAQSPKEYARWAREICGVAAARMVVKYFVNKDVLLVPLAKNAFRHGVYKYNMGKFSPMLYNEFSSWIRRYGIQADARSRLSVEGIRYALAKKKLPIVSVNPGVRGYAKPMFNQKGGHLVVVIGYDNSKRVLYLNNPSGFLSLGTQKRHEISESEFRKYFAGRGIITSLLVR